MPSAPDARLRFRCVALRDAGNEVPRVPNKWVSQIIQRCMAVVATAAIALLQGCSGPPAPSPAPNPYPAQTLKLKISVEKGSEVSRVEVQSLWVIGNLSCAPLIWPAGNRRVKQVEVLERVEKIGDSYVATIFKDRFLPDKCRWTGGAADIKFFNGDYLLSSLGVNNEVLSGRRALEMTCLTRPFVEVGTCGLRDEESFYKGEDKHAFSIAVELMK